MKYYVIGGQYETICYGYSYSIAGAKAISNRNKEYWDNFGGWRSPSIYTEDAVKEIVSNGRFFTLDGEKIIVPVAECAWYHDGKKWVDNRL